MTTSSSAVLTHADARELGITRSRLLGDAYARVARGRYLPAGTDPALDDWIAVVATGLAPGVSIGGWSAARIYEDAARKGDDVLTVFDGVMPALDASERVPLPVLVCAPRSARVVVPDVARVWRSDLAETDTVWLGEAHVTSPDRTAFDLARLWSLVPAVVGLDRLLNLGIVDVAAVVRMVDDRPGYRGIRQARRALELVDSGAESPRESMLRLVWQDAGLPRPRANRVVRRPDGTFVGRVDLIDAAAGVVGEYDGAFHADASRRRSDAARQEALEELGLVVVRATEPDIATMPARSAWQHRLRMAYGRAKRRGPGRWVVTDA